MYLNGLYREKEMHKKDKQRVMQAYLDLHEIFGQTITSHKMDLFLESVEELNPDAIIYGIRRVAKEYSAIPSISEIIKNSFYYQKKLK